VHKQIFNVGDTEENYQVKDIADIVAKVFPGCKVTLGDNKGDNRSYRVSFEKINKTLPGFNCKRDVEKGANQLRDLFERLDMKRETFEFRSFTRLKQLEYLIRTKQLDDNLFWS
jgi:nucleoside-diphosphate-sugar epimerase